MLTCTRTATATEARRTACRSATAPGRGVEREFLALERELTVFLRRARANSGEMAREVHPDLESAAYGLLVRLEECGPPARHRTRRLHRRRQGHHDPPAARPGGAGPGRPRARPGRRPRLARPPHRGGPRPRSAASARPAGRGTCASSPHWDRGEVAELARLLHQLNRRHGEVAPPGPARVRRGRRATGSPASGHRGTRHPVTAPRTPPSRRRASCRGAGTAGRPPRPPAPAPARGRTSACAPLLADDGEAVRPVALAELLHPAGRPVRQGRQGPDLRARERARHRAGRHRRVGRRREEAALLVADGRVGDRVRGAGRRGGARESRSSSTAVTVPSGRLRRAGPSPTAPGARRSPGTSGPGPRSPGAYAGEKGHRCRAWASAVRAMARARTSASGISRRETDSSVSAPPSRAVNQGTECRQPVAALGRGDPVEERRATPPCPEAGSPTAREVLVGAVRVAGLRDEKTHNDGRRFSASSSVRAARAARRAIPVLPWPATACSTVCCFRPGPRPASALRQTPLPARAHVGA